jgi:hypothetical protein
MTNKKLTSLEQIARLADSLVTDIIELSDEDVLDDANEQFDNPTAEVDRLKSVINNALLQSAKTKLTIQYRFTVTVLFGVKLPKERFVLRPLVNPCYMRLTEEISISKLQIIFFISC